MATPRKKTPEAEAQELKISSVGDIKKRLGGIYELPSGIVVRLKNPGGLKAFLGSGKIPNALLPLVEEGFSDHRSKKITADERAKKARDMLKDEKAIEEMMAMLDNVLVQTIVEPPVYPYPAEGELKDPSLLYPDDFDDTDKQYIFQWIQGGVKDLESFRKKLEANVALLSAGDGAEDGSVSDDGTNAG